MRRFSIMLITIILILALFIPVANAQNLDTEDVSETRIAESQIMLRDDFFGPVTGLLKENDIIYVIAVINFSNSKNSHIIFLKINTLDGIKYCRADNTKHYDIYERKEDSSVIYENKDNINNSSYKGKFKITTYCPCSECNGGWNCTALGTELTPGRTIAVDPSIIPLGSKVYIDGIGYRIAEDTGGRIKGNIIDLCIGSHEEAQYITYYDKDVYVVE